MSATLSERWTFTQPSPLGDVTSSYELSADALHFVSDGTIGPGADTLRWDEIAEAATAVVDVPLGQAGGPDVARWVPGRLEWLLVARAKSGAPAFMRPLPDADARDAIVAALRQRLGARWVGERMPLESARRRFRVSEGSFGTLKVVGLVLSVLAVLALMLIAFVFAASLLMLPAGFVLGASVFRRGLNGLRDALQMANTPPSRVSSAALGLVELEGRAVGERSTPAGASGRPSLWWDVVVEAYDDSKDDGGWKQVAARHGGTADLLVLEDATGRMPVWLRDADLLLQEHTWETGKDALPASGVALLAGSAFAWNGGKRLRVRETRMEAGATVYVHGTLDEARHLRAGDHGLARLLRPLRTGEWRPALLRRLPPPLRIPVGVAIAYVDLLFSFGRGGERRRQPSDAPLPALAPNELAVWKGRSGRSLIVSDQRENAALAQLRKRSMWLVGIGGVVLCVCLHELINLF